MKKFIIYIILLCIISIAAGCGMQKNDKKKEDTETTLKNDKELDFTQIDRLGFQDGNTQIYTENKDIIDKMFLKDTVYTEKTDYELYYGQSVFYAYHRDELLYKIIYPTDEYACINGTWYSVENPPDYQEISYLIQDENQD